MNPVNFNPEAATQALNHGWNFLIESFNSLVNGVSSDMVLVLGLPIAIGGGVLMWLFATFETGTAGDKLPEIAPSSNNENSRRKAEKDKEKQKEEENRREAEKMLEKELLREQEQELEKREHKERKDQKERQEREDKEREKEDKRLDWKQGEKGDKRREADLEREIDKKGGTDVKGRKTSAAKLHEISELFVMLLDLIERGHDQSGATKRLTEISPDRMTEAQMADLVAAVSFLKEATPKKIAGSPESERNLKEHEKALTRLLSGDVKTAIGWLEKTANQIENTANRTKDTNRREEETKTAAEIYRHAGSLGLTIGVRVALANYTKAVELDGIDPIKLAECGEISLTAGISDKALDMGTRLLRLKGNEQNIEAARERLGMAFSAHGDRVNAEKLWGRNREQELEPANTRNLKLEKDREKLAQIFALQREQMEEMEMASGFK